MCRDGVTCEQEFMNDNVHTCWRMKIGDINSIGRPGSRRRALLRTLLKTPLLVPRASSELRIVNHNFLSLHFVPVYRLVLGECLDRLLYLSFRETEDDLGLVLTSLSHTPSLTSLDPDALVTCLTSLKLRNKPTASLPVVNTHIGE